MAQKRMFDKAIIDTDRFMDLSLSMKGLYFLLGMEADDEGFVSPKKVLRIHGGSEDDIKVLVAKNFLIAFKSGVVVITDWQKNNWLDTRRIKPTEYQPERKMLALTDSKEYVLSNGLATATLVERSIEESRVVESIEGAVAPAPTDDVTVVYDNPPRKAFVRPKVEEIRAYCEERKNGINADQFFDYYQANGWKVGKSAMKDWKATVRNWERRSKEFGRTPSANKQNLQTGHGNKILEAMERKNTKA